MESILFVLFAIGLTLYFTWSLNREMTHETDFPQKQPHMRKYRPALPNKKYIRNRVSSIKNSLKGSDNKQKVKYDEDYAELQLVIDNLTPDAVFNPAVLPLSTTGRGEKRDVYPHANKLVYKLGRESGIGLRLIDIRRITRETTEIQTRYGYELIVQRDTPEPCERMAIIAVQMILDFSQPSGEGFFKDYMLTNEPTPKLESVVILEYVNDYVDLQSEAVTQFYAIDGDESANFLKQNDIRKIVTDTRKKHNHEVRDLNVLIDENGEDAQDYQSRLPEYDAVPGKGAGAGTRLVAERFGRDCN
jgi:hypothetical protein